MVLSFRSTSDKKHSDVAVVDLLPSGFSAVLTDEGKAKGSEGYAPEFIDTREDRVISYGVSRSELREINL